MSYSRKINRAARLNNRRNTMRYIVMSVTKEDQETRKKRADGAEEFKGGLFGQLELLRRLLEISPKCTKMADVTQLRRVDRKMEKIENDVDPVLELPQDEWDWIKGALDHDKYSSYGAPLMRRIGDLLEAVTEAKTEKEPKLHAVE